MKDLVEQPSAPTPIRHGDDGNSNWGARLREHRTKTFVGRAAELELFRQALRAERPAFQVLAVDGPPGSGKTTLLKRFASECDDIGIANALMDARRVRPTPHLFLRALYSALGLAEGSGLTAALAQRGRFLFMIDNYDVLHPLHDWLFETVLPQFPASAILVVAGREPPHDLWRRDPAWRELVCTVTLGNFSPDETRTYLTLRAVPDHEHERLARFSRGHPLALSLAADLYEQRSISSFDPRSAPDVMQSLVRRFVGDVGDSRLRAALEASAIVRVTTEAVLAAMMDCEDARAEFEWLCGLSFVEFSPTGIYPHDLVRDAITLDLLWRDPQRFEALRRRAHDFYAPVLLHPDEEIQAEALTDYLYLYRHHDALRPFLDRHGQEALLPKIEPASRADYPPDAVLGEKVRGGSVGPTTGPLAPTPAGRRLSDTRGRWSGSRLYLYRAARSQKRTCDPSRPADAGHLGVSASEKPDAAGRRRQRKPIRRRRRGVSRDHAACRLHGP